jgi:predicted metal-dependent phosphoesterase TrpH
MSTERTVSSAAAPGPPDDRQALQEEIERTREHLGETVEALVAKVDVKAQAQDKVRQLTGRLKNTAAQADVKGQAQQRARHLGGLLKRTAGRGRHRATTAAASISQVTPETVKRAADGAAATTGRHRRTLAVAAGAAVASVLAWLLIRRWRR